ncbi:MAG: lysostaphin resistance A-like protein [Thermoanaerobaculia bacterium]
MDAGGLSALSALPLFPLTCLFWYLERLARQSMGFVWGQWRHYCLAALYPVAVLGAAGLVSAVAGAVDTSQTNWEKAWLNFALVAVSTFLAAILTEEGFFRGWLFAALERAGENRGRIVVWSSIAFSLWHVSAVTLSNGFALPVTQIPVFLVNAAVMGAVWGLLRSISGSVVVASLSHGVWNGGAYVFFGFGTRIGALGIKDTAIHGPEVGILGLALNLIFAAAIWRWWKARTSSSSREIPEARERGHGPPL